MQPILGIFEKEHRIELVMFVIMVGYLMSGMAIPDSVGFFAHSMLGKVILASGVVALFMYSNPLLGIAGALIAFSWTQFNLMPEILMPYEPERKPNASSSSSFSSFVQFPYTLEQEMVAKMAPMVRSGMPLSSPSYKPTINELHDASKLN